GLFRSAIISPSTMDPYQRRLAYFLTWCKKKCNEFAADSKSGIAATKMYETFDITARALSQHLRVLLDAKQVALEMHTQQNIYQMNSDQVADIEERFRPTQKLWHESSDRLDGILMSEKKRDTQDW